MDVQWTGGTAPHNINYGPATNRFFTDVPFAGDYDTMGDVLLIQ